MPYFKMKPAVLFSKFISHGSELLDLHLREVVVVDDRPRSRFLRSDNVAGRRFFVLRSVDAGR